MLEINKVAVIGSGTMGAGIAATLANASINVYLYDIAAENNPDRSHIAKLAIDNMLANPLKPLMDKSLVKYIHPKNLSDNLEDLKDVDWVIEVIVEKLNIKHDLFNKIAPYLKTDVIISSNTSTIPLKDLVKNLNENLQKRFVITHFFNPPRHLDLLEFVVLEHTDKEVINSIKNFCEINLGRKIVNCKDSPGFIANRLGCYWLEMGARIAIAENIHINQADKAIATYMQVPKTGIFGLWDLIGIDLMPLISNSIISNLDDKDDYKISASNMVEIVKHLIENKQLGRKTKAGFYKVDKAVSKSFMMDAKTRAYVENTECSVEKIASLRDLKDLPTNYGRFAWKLIMKTLNYAASLVPSAAFNIRDVDEAMKTGYGWKYGPFELIDMFSNSETSGAAWLKMQLEMNNITPSKLLSDIENNKFYSDKAYYSDGKYHSIVVSDGVLPYEDIISKPDLVSSNGARLVDMGDSILCMVLTNKMGVLDHSVFSVIESSINYLEQKPFEGMVIIGDDKNFCAGADVNNFIKFHENADYASVKTLISHGQRAMNAIKNSSKTVVCAVNGVAFGGGCELVLHAHGNQVDANAKIGLVETRIGLIPGWGGCKEMLMRPFNTAEISRPIDDILSNLSFIIKGLNADSAFEAINMGFLNKNDTGITFNKDRLFYDSKLLVKKLLTKPRINKSSQIMINYDEIMQKINALYDFNKMLPHEKKIVEILIKIFTAGGKSVIKEDEINQMELDGFIELLSQKAAYERMISLINNKKVINN